MTQSGRRRARGMQITSAPRRVKVRRSASRSR
jgi:hypothetical protein